MKSNKRDHDRSSMSRLIWILTGTALVAGLVMLFIVNHALSRIQEERKHTQAAQVELVESVSDIRSKREAAFRELRSHFDNTKGVDRTTAHTPDELLLLVHALHDVFDTFAFADSTHDNAMDELEQSINTLIAIHLEIKQWELQSEEVHLGWNDAWFKVQKATWESLEAAQKFEGHQRLQRQVDLNRYRRADAEAAPALAISIVDDLVSGRDLATVKTELSDLTLFAERLRGESEIDNLISLKDNEMRQALARLHRAVEKISGDQEKSMMPLVRSIQEAVFGSGAYDDTSHQTLVVGQDGLYSLHRKMLLSEQRGQLLKNEILIIRNSCLEAEHAVSDAVQDLTTTTVLNAEHTLRAAWRNALLTGAGLIAIFLLLARKISMMSRLTESRLRETNIKLSDGLEREKQTSMELEATLHHLEEARQNVENTNHELARFNKAMVGRELRILSLKLDVNVLLIESGKPPLYTEEAGNEGLVLEVESSHTLPGQKSDNSISLSHDTPVVADPDLEKPQLDISFIPIVCSAPLIYAHSHGYFARHGLDVTLKRSTGWSGVKDLLVYGHTDAAHMLSPMPLACALGIDGRISDLRLAAIQNVNGQALTLSTRHIEIRDPKEMKGFKFGVPYRFSMQYYLLCTFLTQHGIDPLRDVEIIEVAPPRMPYFLEKGWVDGVFAPEPFNQILVYMGIGFIHTLSKDIWDGHPCCSFVTSQQFIDANPNTYQAMLKSLLEAQLALHRAGAEERRGIAAEISKAQYLDMTDVEPVAQALSGHFPDGRGNTCCVPNYIDFLPHPFTEYGTWILSQMKRWNQLSRPVDSDRIVTTVFMQDTHDYAEVIGFDRQPEPDLECICGYDEVQSFKSMQEQEFSAYDEQNATPSIASNKSDDERLETILMNLSESAGGREPCELSITGEDRIGQLEQMLNELVLNNQFSTLALKEQKEMMERKVSERTASLHESNRAIMSLFEDAETAALTDRLTGLPNRAFFMDRLNQIMKIAHRDGSRFAVLFFDFDRFKIVNDSLGHEAGDALLCSIADVFRRELSNSDMVARLGGDEFLVLLNRLADWEDAKQKAQSLLDVFSEPHLINDRRIVSTASIGLVTNRRIYEKADDMIRDADVAMYQAKDAGKGQVVEFDQTMHEHAMDQLALEEDLRRAVPEQQLRLVYQPIVSLEMGHVLGFEALVRWDHPERGTISPLDFIPIAEDTGLIDEIGRWVLVEACRQLSSWNRRLTFDQRFWISINVSKRQLLGSTLFDDILENLQRFDLQPQDLKLEITESTIVTDSNEIVSLLKQLRNHGLAIAMDDFGTGLSSLGSLHLYPIDILKIDRSFIRDIDGNRALLAVVASITTLADNLNITTVAEGIESPSIIASLQSIGCTLGQGYHFAKPMIPANVEKYLLGIQRERRSA